MEYLPLVKSKIASDGNLYKLREYDDVEDHPTVLPIPMNYMHAPSNADFNQVCHTTELLTTQNS